MTGASEAKYNGNNITNLFLVIIIINAVQTFVLAETFVQLSGLLSNLTDKFCPGLTQISGIVQHWQGC